MKIFHKSVAKCSMTIALLLFAISVIAQCPVPVNLSDNSIINGNGLNEVQLSWDNVTEALQYSVAYRVDGGGGSYTIKSASSNSLTITGLPATTTYEWKVRSVCSADWSTISDYSTSDTFTTAAGSTCDAPTNPSSNSTGSGSTINEVDLSWDAMAGAVYYNLAYRAQGAGSFTYKTVSTNSHTLSGLPASTNYEWKVRTICASDWSVVSSFTGLENFTSGTGVECTVPTNVAVSNTTSTEFTVQWTSVTAAEQYYIQYRIPAEQTWAEADYRFTYRSSDKTITGLESDKEYEVRMRAICDSEGGKWTSFSDYSAIVSFDTFVCSTPSNLSSIPSQYSAILSWDEVPGVLFYQIKYRLSGTFTYSNQYITSDGTVTSAEIDGLDPNTSYDWIIRSRCDLSSSGNNSAYSSVQTFTTTDGDPCTTPTGLMATPSSNDALLEWNAVSAAFEYQLKWREQGQTSFFQGAIVEHPTTNYTIPGLSSNTTYEWLIRTLCEEDGSVSSNYSSIQTFTTDAGPSCDTPSNLNSSPSSNSATLSWDPLILADQYRLKYRVQGSGAFNTTVIVTAPSSSINITGLSPSTTYEWLVRTECPESNSSYTAIQVFTTTASMAIAEPPASKVSSQPNAKSGSFNKSNNEVLLTTGQLNDSDLISSVIIFPNPTNGVINVLANSKGELTIVNVLGELIKEANLVKGETVSIDLSNFGSGMYLVRFNSKDNKAIKRVIVN
ncbi:MAG: fibronectin type III domain-containing protein [Fulvivirga sp.]